MLPKIGFVPFITIIFILLLPLSTESSISTKRDSHQRYTYSTNNQDIEYHYPEDKRDIDISPLNDQSKNVNVDSLETGRRYRVLSQKTSGILRTYQRGTAIIPKRGATVNAFPEPRKTYRTTVTSTVLEPVASSVEVIHGPPPLIPPPPPSSHPMTRRLPSQHEHHWPGTLNDSPSLRDEMNFRGICNRCPLNQTMIAKKGRQYIIMKDPMPKQCRRRGEVRMQTIRGPNPGDALGEGSHYTLVAQHRGAKVHLCMYRIDVAVRRCPELTFHPHVMAECSADSAWGSQCRFTCHEGYELDGPETIECTGRLRWRRPAPQCIKIEPATIKDGSCRLPSTPDGTFDCKTPDITNTNIAIGLLPQNTICRIQCNDGFTLNKHQEEHLSVIECYNGSWNITQEAFKCISIMKKHSRNKNLQGSEQQHETNHIKRHHHGYPSNEDTFRREQQETEICDPNPCQGGGTCLQAPDYGSPLCICPKDRQGDKCERVICPDDHCLNGGHCIALGNKHICYCRTGFNGNRCELQRSYHS